MPLRQRQEIQKLLRTHGVRHPRPEGPWKHCPGFTLLVFIDHRPEGSAMNRGARDTVPLVVGAAEQAGTACLQVRNASRFTSSGCGVTRKSSAFPGRIPWG
jgi:hypothetical protein